MTIKPKNILLVKNRALGDAIISISAGRYLKSLFPEAKITFATPAWTQPVFTGLDHPFDGFIPLQIRNIVDVYKFWTILKAEEFDFIYELHWGPRTGRILKLFSKLNSIAYGYLNHHKYANLLV